MKKKWVEQADRIANHLKDMTGMLVGVAVDDDEKATAFRNYWLQKQPHVEFVDQNPLIGKSVFIRIRLKGCLQ